MQRLSPLDHLIVTFDQGLRTLIGQSTATTRNNPAEVVAETELNPTEKQLSVRLMRVNHAGEVAAQALYHGQALTARAEGVRESLQESAREENDHLLWCQSRVKELEGRVSFLSPFWYTSSFAIGALTGLVGDKWSLGFVAETERQVVQHLDGHLQRLSKQDLKSRAIVQQMQEDEAHHATVAIKLGGVSLPKPICWLMGRAAKVMTTTAYWI